MWGILWGDSLGKASGRHPDKALTAIQVRQLKTAGRYTDGNGLHLVVDPSGAKRWLLRIMVQGKRCDIGLGGVGLVSLAEARETAAAYRKIARAGGDPLADKRAARKVIPTFKQAAEQVHGERKPGLSNKKHINQWIKTLETYAYPELSDLAVDKIDTPAILRVLSPIWLTKPETARRVRQRIGSVMDWAKASGHRSGDNPVDGVTLGLPQQKVRDNHHEAMPYAEVPAFVQSLRSSSDDEIGRLALEFLILTACRTGEIRGAQWSEFDLKAKLWTIPADRMKARREHRVPLSARALQVLTRAKELSSESPFVFPGASVKKATPISNMTMLQIMKRRKLPYTVHGFRSSFRDWASEATSFPSEVAEMALAHTVENKVEAAYRRGDLLQKRSEMMETWSIFVS